MVPSTQYIYCPSIGHIQAYCRKVASSALIRTLFDLKEHAPSGRAKLEKPEARALIDSGMSCALFVRHPYDRIVSAYEFFCHRYPEVNAARGRPDVQFWYRQHGLPGPGQFGLDKFVTVALRQWPQDKHVAPQAPEHRDDKGLLPSFIWPVDHSEEGWASLREIVPGLPEVLIRKNETKRESDWRTYIDDLEPATRRLLESFYSDDMRLYEEALNYRDRHKG